MTIVAIDGPTGVGKSTTAQGIAARLGADLLLDPVSVSPLLDAYYTGQATPAAELATELAFLHGRAELLGTASPDRPVVTDFTVMRTGPFAEFLCDTGDRDRVIGEMWSAVTTGPCVDVLVLLRAHPTTLYERVRSRDRTAEVDLTLDHLIELQRHFDAWRDELVGHAATAFEIDTSRWDPRRADHLDELVGRIGALLDEPRS